MEREAWMMNKNIIFILFILFSVLHAYVHEIELIHDR